MSIKFPNRSRSYDATRRAVRFWGYDRSMESSFFVTVDALRQIQPDTKTNAVDLVRRSISTASVSTPSPRKSMPGAEEAPTI
jgi:hypothetical protein